jgi:hypothetical protein
LTYAFDLSDQAEYKEDAITALEKLETYVVNRGTQNESTRSKIWRWLNKFNKETERWLDNLNWALQPTLFVEVDNVISRPSVEGFTTYEAGEVKLLPSSWTAEVLAPAFKKYVVVTAIDGNPVKADDPVNKGLLGQVVPGSVDAIPFTIEAGKTYTIQYSAVDFEGNIRTLTYKIKGVNYNN